MKIPFITSDDCKHENIELRPQDNAVNQAQWDGGDVRLHRIHAYYKYCPDCDERVSHMSHDAEGNLGREFLESITIPADVVEEYRESNDP